MDCPEPAALSSVITNRFEVEAGEVVGRNVTVTCFQAVCAPESGVDVEARLWPDVV